MSTRPETLLQTLALREALAPRDGNAGRVELDELKPASLGGAAERLWVSAQRGLELPASRTLALADGALAWLLEASELDGEDRL